jgi:hypothetical protein
MVNIELDSWFVCGITRQDSMQSHESERVWYVTDVTSLKLHEKEGEYTVAHCDAIFKIHMNTVLPHHMICDQAVTYRLLPPMSNRRHYLLNCSHMNVRTLSVEHMALILTLSDQTDYTNIKW